VSGAAGQRGRCWQAQGQQLGPVAGLVHNPVTCADGEARCRVGGLAAGDIWRFSDAASAMCVCVHICMNTHVHACVFMCGITCVCLCAWYVFCVLCVSYHLQESNACVCLCACACCVSVHSTHARPCKFSGASIAYSKGHQEVPAPHGTCMDGAYARCVKAGGTSYPLGLISKQVQWPWGIHKGAHRPSAQPAGAVFCCRQQSCVALKPLQLT